MGLFLSDHQTNPSAILLLVFLPSSSNISHHMFCSSSGSSGGGTSWRELAEVEVVGATPPVGAGFCFSSALVFCDCCCLVGTQGGGCFGTVSYLSSDSWSMSLSTIGYGTILKLDPGGMVLTPVTINSIRMLNAIGFHQNIEQIEQNCALFWNCFVSFLLFRKYFLTVSEVFWCILGCFDTVCENWLKPSQNEPITQLLHTI